MAVIGFCNPMMDVTVNRSVEVISTWGVKLGDAILVDDTHGDKAKTNELIEELLRDPTSSKSAGGSVQNTLRVAQWFLPPDSTAILGAIGTDGAGDGMIELMKKAGVAPYYQRIAGDVTGVCVCLIHEGERAMIAAVGAAGKFEYSRWDTPEVLALFKGAKVCALCGYFIASSESAVLGALVQCLGNGVPIALTVSSPWCIEQSWGPTLRALLLYSAIIFGNEEEIPLIEQKLGLKGVEALANYGGRKRIVVLTRGSQPTLASDGGPAIEVPVLPLERAEIKDTVGAGDSFAGGFLAGYVKGANLRTCIEAGHYAASASLKESGCTLPLSPPEFPL